MKVFVFFSGGKDSQACMIYAKKKYGDNVKAIFCDTGHESHKTTNHILEVCEQLKVQLYIVKSAKFSSLFALAKKKRRFPSRMARFCTTELKIKPAINFILDNVKEDCLFIQGIRADESPQRALMSPNCQYFKYYTTPSGKDKNGYDVFNYHRRKEVLKWIKKYDDSMYYPIFQWTSQDVIDYILENNQKPNPLYYQGFSRVGCFPCVLCNFQEIRQLAIHYPEQVEKINEQEKLLKSTFFPPGKIPDRFCDLVVYDKDGKQVAVSSFANTLKYVLDKNPKETLFEKENNQCLAAWKGMCE